jgi:hypothetical protein
MRILFASANPAGTDPLRLDQELREIEEKLSEADDRANFELRTAWALRPDDLLRQLTAFRPNILHFSGHGTEANEIMLEDSAGQVKPISKQMLQDLFREFRDQLYVVVLNACYSEAQAAELVDEVAVVIGMDGAVGDRAAIAFAASFYRALGFNCTIQDAFDQGLLSIQWNTDEQAHVKTPRLHHSTSLDPTVLTAESLSAAVLARLRAEDFHTPESIAALLRKGTRLILPPGDPGARLSERRRERPLMLELGMRHSDGVFVVEVDSQMQIGSVAAHLARQLMSEQEASDYTWDLVRDDEAKLRGSHTFEMAGVRTGERVLLVGKPNKPTWMPEAA